MNLPTRSKPCELIVALDVPTRAEALRFCESLPDVVQWVKIGLELFSAEGPGFVREVCAMKKRVMLDLKLHDIPATVERTVERLGDLGPEFLTIHASGGLAMLTAAQRAAEKSRVKLLAVTVLTSMNDADLSTLGINRPVAEQVSRLARLARQGGISGLVASAQEAPRLRQELGDEVVLVTPGVRPQAGNVSSDDQSRVVTPAVASQNGSTYIVVGRPIRDAQDPASMAKQIVTELQHAAQ